jgi:hypothetical protein
MVCNGLPLPVVDICIDSIVGVLFVLLATAGVVMSLRSAWVWLRALLLRAAFHHVLFGLGAAGIATELLTDVGIVDAILDVVDSIIGVIL